MKRILTAVVAAGVLVLAPVAAHATEPVEVFWEMTPPNGTVWGPDSFDSESTNPDGTNATWPQVYSPDGAVQCGAWYQADFYSPEDAAMLTADGLLHYQEDWDVVISWRFVWGGDCPPPYEPPVLNCGEWEVPGWLNEHGDPTSCVSNHPCPGLEAPACGQEPPVVVTPDLPVEETPVEETPADPVVEEEVATGEPQELAETGFDSLALYLAAGLVLAGGLLYAVRNARSNRERANR